MVEISLSGSGEGPGEATTRGYSTTLAERRVRVRRLSALDGIPTDSLRVRDEFRVASHFRRRNSSRYSG
jgi:hypothetical protein